MPSTVPIGFQLLLWLLLLGSLATWVGIIRRLLARRPLVLYEPHLVVPWSGWDVVVLVFLALMTDLLALGSATRGTEAVSGELSVMSVAVASAAHLVWLVAAVSYLSGKAGAYFDDLGLDTRNFLSDLRLGLTTFLAALLPVNGIQLLLTQWMPSEHPITTLAKEQSSLDVMALATIVAVVVAPIFEEFIFRVLLQGWFEKQEILWHQRQGDTRSVPPGFMPIAVVSALFGALHWGHGPDPVALFVLSLFLGYVYQRTHRIIAPLVVHVCFNGLAMLNLWVTLG